VDRVGGTVSTEGVREFDEVFADEYPRVVALGRRVTGDRELGREIAQEAFVRAFARWRRIGRYDDPGAWVRKVAVREAIRQAQRRTKRRALEQQVAVSQREPVLLNADVEFDLDDALAPLSPQQRAAVSLVWIEDRTTFDAAQVMGCRPATVRVHLHRARQVLRPLLEDDHTPGASIDDADDDTEQVR
jgi:RNA polymerase sigma-70 factor (ECF subfamily)